MQKLVNTYTEIYENTNQILKINNKIIVINENKQKI